MRNFLKDIVFALSIVVIMAVVVVIVITWQEIWTAW